MNSTDSTEANFYQAQIHLGTGSAATPKEVAVACLHQAGFDLSACLAMDPSIALTLNAPPGLLQEIIKFAKEQKDG